MSEITAAQTLRRIVELMHEHRLRPADKCVGSVILDRLGSSSTGTAKIFVKEIATEAHVSERKVQTACARLAEFGYLVVSKRHGRASLYSLAGAPETTAHASMSIEASA
jgi:DNA-binding transcriptional regulator PaaX